MDERIFDIFPFKVIRVIVACYHDNFEIRSSAIHQTLEKIANKNQIEILTFLLIKFVAENL